MENAILHGLKNKRGEKWIRIYTIADGEDIDIVVEDNGVGMDVTGINEELQSDHAVALDKSNSIGLFNINARVRHLFGRKYGVRLESSSGQGCRVYLKLPKKKEG